MDIGYNKRPPVVSWDDLKECMRLRLVPPHFRKDLMLKLQWFQQGTLSVDAYFKELESLLLKVNLKESEEAMIARFVSGLRRDIQDVVELQEYSSLGSLVYLAMKVESRISKRNAFKNSHLGKIKSLLQTFLLRILLSHLMSLSLLLLLIYHLSNRLVKSVLNVWDMVT